MNNDAVSTVDANVSTIVDLLEDKGIAWGEYQEDMPYTGFEGKEYVNQVTGANAYVRKHNPAVIYGANSERADRLGVMKNLTLFYSDLENETLPQWMFITPNMTSDGHDTSVTVAGKWTRSFLEPLLTDTRFMNNTVGSPVVTHVDVFPSPACEMSLMAMLESSCSSPSMRTPRMRSRTAYLPSCSVTLSPPSWSAPRTAAFTTTTRR